MTLSRDLGIETVRPQLQLSREQRRLRRCARVLSYLVQQWEKATEKRDRSRNSSPRTRLGCPQRWPRSRRETIDEAFKASQEADWYMLWLNSFDRLSPAELVAEYQHFQRSLKENGF
jgi:hypothetical protein